MKQFNEATRVQMPAMVHLTRIGYTYFGKLSEDKNGIVYDGDTNILLPIFDQQFKKLNPGHEGECLQVLKDIRKELNDDDLVIKDKTIWCTQKAMVQLFGIDKSGISRYIADIFKEEELQQDTTVAKIATVVNKRYKRRG